MNKISSKHFIFFIIGVSFISLKSYPSIFINIGGRDTWLYALIACVLFTAYLIYMIHICKSTDTYDINLIFTSSLSKILGNILLLLFCINLFFTALEAASVEANILHSCIFLETPVWYILIFFLVPSLFLLNKDIKTLLIFILLGVSALIINSIIYLVMTQSYKTMNYVLPVLGAGINGDFFITIALILGSLSTFVVALPFMKYIREFQGIKIHSFYGAAIVSAIVIVSILGVITAFGPLRAANIFYPEYILGQRVEIGGFIEFGEFFFILQIVVGFFIKYVLSSYAIIIIFDKLIKNRKLFIGIYTFLTFVFASFLGRNNFILYDILKYYQIFNLIIFLIIPISTYTIFYFKKGYKLK